MSMALGEIDAPAPLDSDGVAVPVALAVMEVVALAAGAVGVTVGEVLALAVVDSVTKVLSVRGNVTTVPSRMAVPAPTVEMIVGASPCAPP